jgi:hypothetical protein
MKREAVGHTAPAHQSRTLTYPAPVSPYSLLEHEHPEQDPVAWVCPSELAMTHDQISLSELWPKTGGAW